MLLGGDIIIAVGKREISGMKELLRALDKLKVGQNVVLRIFRNGRSLELKTPLVERP